MLNRNHSSEARVTHAHGKKLSQDIFNLMDSEISLLTGNTEEFYNESLKFLEDNLEELGLEKSSAFFYKILQVVIVESATYRKSSEKGSAALFRKDYMGSLCESYPKFGYGSLHLNRIESDDGYSYLKSIYLKLKSVFDSHYYPECGNLFRKMKILIAKNNLFSLNTARKLSANHSDDEGYSEDHQEEEDHELDAQDEAFMLQQDLCDLANFMVKDGYSLDDNYMDYESLVADIVRKRYRSEYASRVFYANKSKLIGYLAKGERSEKTSKFETRLYAKSIDTA